MKLNIWMQGSYLGQEESIAGANIHHVGAFRETMPNHECIMPLQRELDLEGKLVSNRTLHFEPYIVAHPKLLLAAWTGGAACRILCIECLGFLGVTALSQFLLVRFPARAPAGVPSPNPG
jgi:hypothetical protein